MNRTKSRLPIVGFILITTIFMFSSMDATNFGGEPISIEKTRIVVDIEYMAPAEVTSLYLQLGGHKDNVLAFSYKEGGVCTIIAAPPQGWNDREALAIIGHEVLHCQGGKHN